MVKRRVILVFIAVGFGRKIFSLSRYKIITAIASTILRHRWMKGH
jgi:hypothetical protein